MRKLTNQGIDQIRVREFYFATSNNCLVENIGGGSKTVWLPTYGHGTFAELQTIDAENKKLWEKEGFTVKMLGDFHPFAKNLGAVHCIKKYMARR